MKTVNRAQLRGKPLERICYSAHTTRHEFGSRDNRVFCFGIMDGDDLIEPCRSCKALMDCAEPPEGVTGWA